jgi:exodeoxyribonuclease-3
VALAGPAAPLGRASPGTPSSRWPILGDYNVCPTPADLAPGALPPTDALVHPHSRARFRAMEHMGLTDALRALHPADAPFTYWDYGAAFEANRGLRIDHALVSAELAERLIGCGVDTVARSEDSPSDHAPVLGRIRRLSYQRRPQPPR